VGNGEGMGDGGLLGFVLGASLAVEAGVGGDVTGMVGATEDEEGGDVPVGEDVGATVLKQ